MTIRLEEPVLDNGTRFVNFFEGRILTGRDLSDQQAADRRQRLRLGRSIGPGIVRGLEASLDTVSGTAQAPVLRVSPGLAISRTGEALEIASTKRVELVRALSEAAGGRADLFGPCVNQAPGEQLPAGVGIYLLTIGPASAFEEEAPKAGLGSNGVADGCGRRYATLGVRFRLIRIEPSAPGSGNPTIATEIGTLLGSTGTTAVSRLRNLLTHAFLGTEQVARFAADPFDTTGGASTWARYGLLDALGAGNAPLLDPCEVPIAALYWTMAGVGFVDRYMVRRRLGLMPIDARWPLIHSERRAAEAEAMLFQFQAQLGWLQDTLPSPGPLATRDFRFLPPAGLLRMSSATAFFSGLSVEAPVDLAPARFLAVLESGRAYPAIDLAAKPAPTIRLFRVGGASSWLLYTDARIPSPEAEAARTEARLAALEDKVEDDSLPLPVAPVLIGAPMLSGTGRIGSEVTLDPGQWGGQPAPNLAFAWFRNGDPIPDEKGRAYVPSPVDEGAALTCRVTASNAGGSAEAETAPLTVTWNG
jgi:hypothetical protein